MEKKGEIVNIYKTKSFVFVLNMLIVLFTSKLSEIFRLTYS